MPAVVGILHVPRDYTSPRTGIASAWRRHLVASAAVRGRDYMEALFKERFPDGSLVETSGGKIAGDVVQRADQLVLLYPDAIGMDFGAVESMVRSRWPDKGLLVLNGRRRFFRLERHMRRRLAFLRFLEKTRSAEFGFLLVFAVVTPVLIVVDALKGRR